MVGLFLIGLNLRPSMESFDNHILKVQQTDSTKKLRVTFLGVSTLLFDDGETAWMTDGFFTRPSLPQVLFGKIESDRSLVAKALERLHVTKLAAVIPIHSHYDHALDSALVAQLTGATLVGSESTAQIGRGFGLAEDKIQILSMGQKIQIGKFQITILEAAHSPEPLYIGAITHPLRMPAPAREFKMGDCYSLLVEYENQKILVHGSGGYLPGALKQHQADVVYLGVGLLGRQSEAFRENYWNEVVLATKAKRVFVVHWDDFFKPLDQTLVPMPFLLDNFKMTMDDFTRRGKKDSVELHIPLTWQSIDPFDNRSRP